MVSLKKKMQFFLSEVCKSEDEFESLLSQILPLANEILFLVSFKLVIECRLSTNLYYLFKVDNRKTRKRFEICLRLIKTAERHQ